MIFTTENMEQIRELVRQEVERLLKPMPPLEVPDDSPLARLPNTSPATKDA